MKYRIPVVKTRESFAIPFHLVDGGDRSLRLGGPAALSSGCFAFLTRRRCMMRISVERAVEFPPRVLAAFPWGDLPH